MMRIMTRCVCPVALEAPSGALPSQEQFQDSLLISRGIGLVEESSALQGDDDVGWVSWH